MPFTSAELVAIRKFCGYRVRSTEAHFWDAGAADLEYIVARLSEDEASEVRTAHLAVLPGLEADILLAGKALDTDKAAIWERNRTEARDRAALYNGARRRLCEFLGVEPGPGLASGCRIVRR